MTLRNRSVERIPHILEDIVAAKKRRLEIQKEHMPMAHFSEQLSKENALQSLGRFHQSLVGNPISIIAEIKRASPSKGIISIDFDPLKIAAAYEKLGASAISVLTEEDYFLGSASIFKKVRALVKCPLLRKDFIIDSYQIYESAVLGADAILLIARLLDKETLKEMMGLSHSLGMDVLVEVHHLADLEKACYGGAKIIGVNNRDLNTFETSLSHSVELSSDLPSDALWVSESGITSAEDIRLLREAGYQGFLVGEALMRDSKELKILKDIFVKNKDA